MAPNRPSPASSDDTTTTFSDKHSSPSPLPSLSLDPAPESDASSSSSLVVSDGSSGSQPAVTKKRIGRRVRLWPAADEIALLEAFTSHLQQHGRRPSNDDLVAALRGRLRTDGPLDKARISSRVQALRVRFMRASIQLSLGIVPEKETDLRIYKLSKLIWDGTGKKKVKKTGKEKKARAVDARPDRKGFGELARLYPCLAAEVDAIDAGCAAPAGMLKRAFGRIGDNKAAQLEAKVKRQRVAEAKASAKLDDLRTDVASTLLKLIK